MSAALPNFCDYCLRPKAEHWFRDQTGHRLKGCELCRVQAQIRRLEMEALASRWRSKLGRMRLELKLRKLKQRVDEIERRERAEEAKIQADRLRSEAISP